MWPRFLLLLFLSLTSVMSLNAKVVVSISTQADFDKISDKITAALKTSDKDIFIAIAPGKYVIKGRGFWLNKIDAPDKSIHIVGNGTIVIPEGREYKSGDRYDGEFSPDNSWMSGKTDISIWSHVRYADGLVEVVNEKTQLCRLKSKESLPNGLDVSNAYILVPHWFQSSVYKVSKIENGYIYFTATDLKAGYKKGYNVNDDYNFAGLNPRYKLCNVEIGEDYLRIVNGRVLLPSGVSAVWEGAIERLLTVNESRFKSVEVSGISFWGNSIKNRNAAVCIWYVNSESVTIRQCEFIGFHSKVFHLASSNSVTIEKNSFRDCYEMGISSYNSCERTAVRGNYFYRMGKRMNNSFCVSCHGPEFIVEDNVFLDFGFDGIGAGESHGNHPEKESYGVIRNNTLSYSPEYLADIANYTIMDSGAIYLRTRNHGVVIQNNYIHDIAGMGTNQGIYCDNGAFGFSIIGNVITDIANSNCIGSRRDASGEERNRPGSGIVATNVNNVIRDNVVDGRILFVGNEQADNGCVMGNNYVLLPEGREMPAHRIKDVTEEGSLIVLDNTGSRRGRIGVSRQSYRLMKKSPEWRRLKTKFVRK